MSDRVEWGDELNAAWWEFEKVLAERLRTLGEGESVLLEQMSAELADDEGCAPYVQFLGGEESVLGEVSGNRWLAEPFRLSEESSDVLGVIGWCAPSDESDPAQANHWFEAGSTETDRLAGMAVQALQVVFEVLHPSFLETRGLDGPTSTPPAPELLSFPADAAELGERVTEAMRPGLGHEPWRDSDGDIPLQSGESVVFVRVVEQPLVVEVFSSVVVDVEHVDRALTEVNFLNRSAVGVTWSVVGTQIICRRRISAEPFVPTLLTDVLESLHDLDQIAEDLVVRCGGRRFLSEPEEQATPIRQALSPRSRMRTIVQLEADEEGSVTPEVAAHLFDYDARALLEQIARLKRDGRLELVPLLRRALRVVVQRDVESA